MSAVGIFSSHADASHMLQVISMRCKSYAAGLAIQEGPSRARLGLGRAAMQPNLAALPKRPLRVNQRGSHTGGELAG